MRTVDRGEGMRAEQKGGVAKCPSALFGEEGWPDSHLMVLFPHGGRVWKPKNHEEGDGGRKRRLKGGNVSPRAVPQPQHTPFRPTGNCFGANREMGKTWSNPRCLVLFTSSARVPGGNIRMAEFCDFGRETVRAVRWAMFTCSMRVSC